MGKHQNCWHTRSISVERRWRYKGFRKLKNIVIKILNLKIVQIEMNNQYNQYYHTMDKYFTPLLMKML